MVAEILAGQGKLPSKEVFEKRPGRVKYAVRAFQPHKKMWLVYSPK